MLTSSRKGTSKQWPFVHFPAQPEPFCRGDPPTTQHMPRNVLSSSRIVDGCQPLAGGRAFCAGGDVRAIHDLQKTAAAAVGEDTAVEAPQRPIRAPIEALEFFEAEYVGPGRYSSSRHRHAPWTLRLYNYMTSFDVADKCLKALRLGDEFVSAPDEDAARGTDGRRGHGRRVRGVGARQVGPADTACYGIRRHPTHFEP